MNIKQLNYYEIIETWSLGYFFIFLSQGLVLVSSVFLKQPLNLTAEIFSVCTELQLCTLTITITVIDNIVN